MKIIPNPKLSVLLIAVFAALSAAVSDGQDLDDLLGKISSEPAPEYANGTFKGTTIINGQSVELAGNNDLLFLVSHRFGAVNSGLYNFFGLDQGTTRLGFEYGVRDVMSLSIGRSNYEKTYDGEFSMAAGVSPRMFPLDFRQSVSPLKKLAPPQPCRGARPLMPLAECLVRPSRAGGSSP